MSSSNPKPTTPSNAEMWDIVSGKKPVPDSIKNSAEYQNEGGKAVSDASRRKATEAHKKAVAAKKAAKKMTFEAAKKKMDRIVKSKSGIPASPTR